MFNTLIFLTFLCREQPPPRGCVLKQWQAYILKRIGVAAASAWLCVETVLLAQMLHGWLAAASAWLCVETGIPGTGISKRDSSRLRVAVC